MIPATDNAEVLVDLAVDAAREALSDLLDHGATDSEYANARRVAVAVLASILNAEERPADEVLR